MNQSEMQKEYDFSKGTRGKYARDFVAGTNIILLDPDVAEVFHDSKQVNDLLRSIAKLVAKVDVEA